LLSVPVITSEDEVGNILGSVCSCSS